MLEIIFGAVISIVSVIVGAVVQMILSESVEAKRQRRELVARIFDRRVYAYEDICEEMIKSRILLENMPNMSSERNKKECFTQAVKSMEECRSIFEKYEIYLKKSVIDIYNFHLKELKMEKKAIENDSSLEYLDSLSKSMLSWIDILLKEMKNDIGLAEMDELFSSYMFTNHQ